MSSVSGLNKAIVAARMNCDGVATSIPTSTGVGAFATKLLFNSVVFDDLGTIADLVNSRMKIPAGYRFARVGYSVAFAVNGTGWRGCRIKNSLGANYGNMRIGAVAADATTNSIYTTPWIKISSPSSGPNTIAVGDYFELWPAQTSGAALDAGADLASSWFSLELKP